jgi:hypothetical protein
MKKVEEETNRYLKFLNKLHSSRKIGSGGSE